jgi:hypothetical protein
LFIAPVAFIATGVVAHFCGRTGVLALPIAAGMTAAALLVPFLATDEDESGSFSVPPPTSQQ